MNGGKHFYHKSDSASVYGHGEDKADGNDGKICYTTGWGSRGLHIVGIKNGNEGRVVRFHTQSNYTGHVKTNTIAVDSWITVGTDENAKMQIRQARIGNKRAGDIEFGNGGDNWKRCYNYNTNNYNRGIASGEFWCSGAINTHSIYTQVIDTDQLKGHAWGSNYKIHIPNGIYFGLTNGNYLEMTNEDSKYAMIAKNRDTTYKFEGTIYRNDADGNNWFLRNGWVGF